MSIGALVCPTHPSLVIFPRKQSTILEKPLEMGQPYYEKQVNLSGSEDGLSWILSTEIPLFRTTHPTRSCWEYQLLVAAQSSITHWKLLLSKVLLSQGQSWPMIGWWGAAKAQPPLTLGKLWRAIPLAELLVQLAVVSIATTLGHILSLCLVLPSLPPYRYISQKCS